MIDNNRSFAIKSVSARNAPQLIEVISEAFLNDPTWSWAFPEPAARKRWWELCIDGAFRYPWSFETQNYAAVSVWIPPSGTEFSSDGEQRIPTLLVELAGDRATDVAELLNRFEQSHPREEPHYYLSLLATKAEHRGGGLGMALLNDNLARIDAEHMPAYLESSNPRNNHRYEALGFVAVSSFQAPGDGPFVTGMWREKR